MSLWILYDLVLSSNNFVFWQKFLFYLSVVICVVNISRLREIQSNLTEFGLFWRTSSGWSGTCWTERFRMNGRAIRDRCRLLGWDSRRREQRMWQQQTHVTGPPSTPRCPIAAVHKTATHVWDNKGNHAEFEFKAWNLEVWYSSSNKEFNKMLWRLHCCSLMKLNEYSYIRKRIINT